MKSFEEHLRGARPDLHVHQEQLPHQADYPPYQGCGRTGNAVGD